MKIISKDLQPFILGMDKEELVKEINKYVSIAQRTNNEIMQRFAHARIQLDINLLREKYGVDYQMPV